MDFQSLTRKELQTLCKKNKIPANMTNVAMADALAALQEGDGIEEILNPMESESQQSGQRIQNGSPGNSHTACRTSTRRKPVKEEPPTTQSIIRTRRGRVGEMADQVNKDLNVPPTPSLPSSRRRAPVTSARERLEQNEEEKEKNNEDRERSDVLETPSIPKTQRKVAGMGLTRRKTECGMEKYTVQGVCSTRRSMRLLEKNMEKLSLKEFGSLEPVVAYHLFHELPEGKGLGEQKSNESDPEEMSDAQKKIVSDALEEEESDDAEGKNENKDKKKEEINNNGKECEEADESQEKAEVRLNDKEPQSKAAIEDQNKVLTREKHNENSIDLVHNMDTTTQNEVMEENYAIFVGEEEGSKAAIEDRNKVLTREKLNENSVDLVHNMGITMQTEVMEENYAIFMGEEGSINEEMVEFNDEDLVEITVMEAEFLEASNKKTCKKQLASAQNSISEPEMEDGSKATIEGRNKGLTREKHNENSVDLVHNMGITMQTEVMEENYAIFMGEEGSANNEMVEFNVEDLVEIIVMEAEFLEASNKKTCKKQLASAQNSISEPEMEDGSKSESLVEFQVLQDGDHFVDDALSVREPELVKNFNSMDSISEPKMEDLSTSESLVEIQVFQDEDNSGMTKNNSMDSISEPKMEDLSRSESLVEIEVSQDEVNSVMTKNNSMDSISEPKMEDLSRSESLVEIEVFQDEDNSGMTKNKSMDSISEPKMEDLSRSEILVEIEVSQDEVHSGMTNISREISFRPFAVDELPGKFLLPKAEVSVEESRTCLNKYNSGDEEEDIKNYSSDEEKKMSLRQLRKMIKELKLTKNCNKEKTNGKQQIENAVRTALQPLPENCMAKDGQEKTTTTTTAANSQFFR